MIGAQAHLVGPEDQRPLAVGAPLELRVALIQPARDQLAGSARARAAPASAG